MVNPFPICNINLSPLEVQEIIPFPDLMILFPVLKIDFEALVTNEKDYVKEVFFLSEAWKWYK